MIRALILSLILNFEIPEIRANEGTFIDEQEFMSTKDAEKRYGTSPFSSQKFKQGSVHERSLMAVDLVKGRKFIGKKPEDVRDQLGAYTGHFWNDNIPTYIIEEGWNKGADTWQLVFLLDSDGNIDDGNIQARGIRFAFPDCVTIHLIHDRQSDVYIPFTQIDPS